MKGIPAPWYLRPVHCRQLICSSSNHSVYQVGSFPRVSKLACRRVHCVLKYLPKDHVSNSKRPHSNVFVVTICDPLSVRFQSSLRHFSQFVHSVDVMDKCVLIVFWRLQAIPCCRHQDLSRQDSFCTVDEAVRGLSCRCLWCRPVGPEDLGQLLSPSSFTFRQPPFKVIDDNLVT